MDQGAVQWGMAGAASFCGVMVQFHDDDDDDDVVVVVVAGGDDGGGGTPTLAQSDHDISVPIDVTSHVIACHTC